MSSLVFVPLPVPKLKVGDEVFVERRGNSATEYRKTEVVSAGTVWVKVKGYSPRFGTALLQSERSNGYPLRLFTAEMLEHYAARKAITVRLTEALDRVGLVLTARIAWTRQPTPLTDAAALALVEAVEAWAAVHAPPVKP